jgi:hypothetical protein
MRCETCDKTYASKAGLVAHQKNTKSCGSGPKVTFDCSFCNKKFTLKLGLNYHLENACEKKQELEKQEEILQITNQNKLVDELKEDLIDSKNIIKAFEVKVKEQEEAFFNKIKDQDVYYDRLIRDEVVSKERLRSEMRLKEEMYEKQINDFKQTVERLHEKIERLAATKSVGTVNNINNNQQTITLNMFITPEFVKSQAARFLTYDHFANGVKGIANFVHDFILVDNRGKLVYACYDKARHFLRYKDDSGNEIDDIHAEKLIAIISQPIKERFKSICKELKENIERNKRFLEDEEESRGRRGEIKERLEKMEFSLAVMEFQSNSVGNIGNANNRDLSRSIEKTCLLPKAAV